MGKEERLKPAALTIPRELKGAVYEAIRKEFSQPTSKSSKQTWTDAFVKSLFQEALKNPNGDIGKMLARNLMQDDILTNLDAQTEKLLSRDIDFLEYRTIKQCFKEQREVIFDGTKEKKVIMTSRRAGKTSLAARLLIHSCCTPNTPCLYIHLKFENAIKQCYDDVIEVAKNTELNITSASKVDGTIEFSNGSSINFKGNKDKSAADKLRGGHYRIIIIDEAAFQTNMKYLVEDTCLPMLADHTHHQILLISTPPRVPHTYFEQCWRSEDWEKYHWTAKQNPYIPDFKEFVLGICKSKGLDFTSPFIRREFLGELVYDTEAQVYKDVKTYKEINNFIPTDCAIGVDFGFTDYNSLVSLIYDRKRGIGYIIQSKKFNKSNVTTIVEEAKAVYNYSLNYCLELNPHFPLNHIFLYCDNNEQSISHEMSFKYKLPIQNALKYDKKLGIEALADYLRTGRIKIQEDDKILLNEIEQTVYKRDEMDVIIPEIDDMSFHPDALDALLYASRQFTYDCNITEVPEVYKDTVDYPLLDNVSKSRAATLPKFMKEEEEDYDSY